MPLRLIWDDRGREQLKRLHPLPKRMIRQALRDFESLWRQQAKPLRGYPGKHTVSIGDYRVILREAGSGGDYSIELIAHRAHAYGDYPIPDDADD